MSIDMYNCWLEHFHELKEDENCQECSILEKCVEYERRYRSEICKRCKENCSDLEKMKFLEEFNDDCEGYYKTEVER